MNELDAVGDPGVRSALLYARSQARPVTADDLADARGIHRNVARSRLERLVDAGMLVPGYERRTGRSGPGAGRPAKTYAVAPELSAIEFPARRYESLLGHVLDAVPARARSVRLREAGAAFGAELAAAARLRPTSSPQVAFARVCTALGTLGYQASVEQASAEGAVIATPTCPLRPLVRARPEAAEIDRGMWASLAAHALAGAEVAQVQCEMKDCLADHASCRVLLSLEAGSRNLRRP